MNEFHSEIPAPYAAKRSLARMREQRESEAEQNDEHHGMNKKNKDKAQFLQGSDQETCSRVSPT